jgi:cation diffusion facilitator CzcD-associated flavoprotein CzcO
LKKQKIAVIGAGPCGLTACKTLAEYELDYECLEASDAIGGMWNIERGGGGYRSLQTNTSTHGMAFSDFPFEPGDPIYPNAAQMVEYFQRYAKHFSLADKIRLRSRVVHAHTEQDGRWVIELENGERGEYSSIIVATGQYTSPRSAHTDIPGDFSGNVLHVNDYLDAAAPVNMRDKRVVVFGLGCSAAEVAADLCNTNAPAGHAKKVILSARSGRWVLPKMIDGKSLDARSPHPSAQLPAVVRALPGNTGQWLMRRAMGEMMKAQSKKLGGASALGLPEPKIQPWEDRPTLSADFIPALQAGKIDVRPGIERFEGCTVFFTDGTQTEADTILYATGYTLDFPFLDNKTLGTDAPELKLYQRVSHPAHDQLFFVGCCRVMCSLWPLAEQQSRWVASLLSGAFELPSAKKRTKQATSLAHSLPIMCTFYVEQLRKQSRGFKKPT